MISIIQDTLRDSRNLLSLLMADEYFSREIEKIAHQIASVYLRKGKLIIFGNGGSMCDAMHFAEELTGRFHNDRPALPAIAVSDPSHISCVANDYGYDAIFSRAVEAYAIPGDMVIGISTSGNSPNVIKGVEAAISRDCLTVFLGGKDGGKMKDMCDYRIIIPSQDTARIQEMHGVIIHLIIQLVEKELFLTENPVPIHDSQSC